MELSVDYEDDERTYEDSGNTTGVYMIDICAHPGGTNNNYISYNESTRAMIKYLIVEPWLHHQSFLGELRTQDFQ